jgi:CspA family cold shock protein
MIDGMDAATGTVVSWNEERGMGFIRSDDGSGDRFVHRSNLADGTSLVVGAAVTYTPGFDELKQKPIVVSCTGAISNGASEGFDADSAAAADPALATGVVKAWMEDRGMGFITPSDGSEDLFVHRSFLLDGTKLTIGAHVAFNPDYDTVKDKLVARNVRGAAAKGAGKGKGVPPHQPAYVQPPPPQLDAASAMSIVQQALSVSVRDLGVDVPTLLSMAGYRRVADPPPPRGSPYGAPTPPSAPPPQAPAPPVGGRVWGVVRAWTEQRGMGFVAPSAGGDDHFVHRSFLQDGNSLTVGSTVQFEPSWDVQKNKPTARNLTGAVTVSTPGASAVFEPLAAPQVVPASAVPATIQHSAPSPPQVLEGAQLGTVKSWYEQRGMGFIAPNSGGADHFIHRSNLVDGNSLTEGAQVYFESAWDSGKNKLIAQNVSGAISTEGVF